VDGEIVGMITGPDGVRRVLARSEQTMTAGRPATLEEIVLAYLSTARDNRPVDLGWVA
jgi:hypothetical protein